MCQMSVVLEKDGATETIMENVARLEAGPEGVLVNALFDEPKLVAAVQVKSIDFMAGTVTLVASDATTGGAA